LRLKRQQNWLMDKSGTGFTKVEESGRHFLALGPKRYWLHPKYLLTPEQRIADMN
jgi:hypothetical protein